ncbi:MAG: SH3 domain-containing protein, partial [Alphaproteobacteria bacterium]|nr:SH3 domain-containing protein [Alphaproteobacteria bacterium]
FHPQKTVQLPKWQIRELRLRQSILPFIFALLLFGLIGSKVVTGFLPDGYFELREIDGQLMAYDMVDSHLMKVSSDIHSKEYLYHITKECLIYHGPDTRYQPMREGLEGQTVRLFGYTPNKKWFKVIFDNGEAGFIQSELLQKGIGKPVPFGSKVYKE